MHGKIFNDGGHSMTTIPEMIKVCEVRKSVALAKVKSGYKSEHSQGIVDAYTEIISDLSKIKQT
jgi:hypothetical protein